MDQIDWQRLVLDLMQERIKVTRIAQAIQVNRTTILRWRDCGGMPLYSHGERLIGFWAKTLGKDLQQVPRLERRICK